MINGRKQSKLMWLAAVFAACCCSSCCFDIVHVKQVPAQLDTKSPPKSSWTLVEKVDVQLDTWYKTSLKSGTKWQYVGGVSHGEVYRTDDQIVTVEGSNTFEAYVVLSGDGLVGFYLPVEKTFSPLGRPVPLKIKRTD